MRVLNFSPFFSPGAAALPTQLRIDVELPENGLDEPSIERTVMAAAMKGFHSCCQMRSR
ncbi:MAG: hypothetical protein J0I46_08850 [Thiobacillus sp.]|nr:hypothetical protein [Thiobacillus sp.]